MGHTQSLNTHLLDTYHVRGARNIKIKDTTSALRVLEIWADKLRTEVDVK